MALQVVADTDVPLLYVWKAASDAVDASLTTARRRALEPMVAVERARIMAYAKKQKKK